MMDFEQCIEFYQEAFQYSRLKDITFLDYSVSDTDRLNIEGSDPSEKSPESLKDEIVCAR
jgi:hypothetical protein